MPIRTTLGILPSRSWEMAIRKTVLVIACMTGAYFIVALATIFYYFLFSILTTLPQEYPGLESWQPFWNLAIISGFLIGLFKSIIDILEETSANQGISPVDGENEDANP